VANFKLRSFKPGKEPRYTLSGRECCIPTKCPSRAVNLGALVVAVITRSICLPRFISAKRIPSVVLCSGLTDSDQKSDQNALRKLLVSSYVGWVKSGPCPSTRCKCSRVTRTGKVRAQQPYGTMSEYNEWVKQEHD